MHFHHYTLQQLVTYLMERHREEPVQACYSQNKNELILEWANGLLRIGCRTPLTYVVPVDEFAKARKNVVDLFPELLGRELQVARVVSHERELILEWDKGFDLVLKMHGIGANAILRKDQQVERLFIQKLEADWEYVEEPGQADESKIPAEIPLDLTTVQFHLREISMIYDKVFARRVLTLMEAGKSFREGYEQAIQEAQSGDFYVIREPNKVRLLLFPIENEQSHQRVTGIQEALSAFLRCHYQYDGYRKQYKQGERELAKPYQKYLKVHKSYQKNITKIEEDRSPEELANILMANLHQVPANSKEVSLPDFYGEGEVKIKLNARLNAQDNAANYYSKAKQRKAKLAYLLDQMDDIEQKMMEAKAELEEFMALPKPEDLPFGQEGFDWDILKAMKQVSRRMRKEQKAAEGDRSPFRTFSKGGYQIFVGKNARNSDELSFKFASKMDTWLHVKDVPGSHVIIRHRSGREIPPNVLEYAAQLAAFYSKRKNDSLVPVQYTPRKYIRKRKGDPPGLVAVDREQVIMVEPIRP
ncbi:MAG: NFACT RNA binding domain-containing protein [Bacteroidota bacterium]